jgi:hypothetical protein
MEQFKRAKVVLLPTKEKSIFHLFTANKPGLYLYPENTIPRNPNCINQHLYIISDEEIKEGDCCINICDNIVEQCKITEYHNPPCINNTVRGYHKKIIATTDTSLKVITGIVGSSLGISLPQPSQQFIEKYIESYNKGEVITDILVEYEKQCDCILLGDCYNPNLLVCDKKLKLKVNPKDNTITIKKLKDSWNREEIINILYQIDEDNLLGKDYINQWIDKNL